MTLVDKKPETAAGKRATAQKAAIAATKTKSMNSSDRQFLPASIEIIETPPSPVKLALLWGICMMVAAALAWSYFGELEIHAVAAGKIQPSGRIKVIQPLEPGKIKTIAVENGARMKEGDLLVELDPTEPTADREATLQELASTVAEILRRNAAAEASDKRAFFPVPKLVFEAGIPPGIRLREQAVLTADLSQLASGIANLDAQIAEKRASKQRLTMGIQARETLVGTLKGRVSLRQGMREKQLGTQTALFDAEQELQKEETQVVIDRGQLIEVDASVTSIERRIDELVLRFVADNAQKLAEVERRREKLAQDLIKLEARLVRTRLVSPIAGTVQQLAVTTIGQVVTTGQELMMIVPSDAVLEVEAMVLNKDIGFVTVGQDAIVKIDAFPFTRYGTVKGTITRVSKDAIEQRDAMQAARPANNTTANAQPASPQTLVFPVTIALERRDILIDGKRIALSPGMAINAEIVTGKRRVIDYIFSPLVEVLSQTAHER